MFAALRPGPISVYSGSATMWHPSHVLMTSHGSRYSPSEPSTPEWPRPYACPISWPSTVGRNDVGPQTA
jgi:hypothetical protein